MEFKPGDRIEVFTSPGRWTPVTVYAVGPDWLTVGNGDPVYGGAEVRGTFRVHVTDARKIAQKIDRGWWTECSACGGNCDPDEETHLHGGPDKGGPMGPLNHRSGLTETNGCGARFTN